MSKAGRKKQDPLKNKYVMPIFVCLAKNPNNSYQISKSLQKAQSTIYEHLDKISSDERWDFRIIKKLNKNKNIYDLNYELLLFRFLDYINKEYLNKLKEFDENCLNPNIITHSLKIIKDENNNLIYQKNKNKYFNMLLKIELEKNTYENILRVFDKLYLIFKNFNIEKNFKIKTFFDIEISKTSCFTILI